MKPIPLHPNLPTPTTAFGNPAPIAQYYICPHCNEQSPLVRQWRGLTGDEISECWGTGNVVAAVEAKLREKNGGEV